MLRRQESCKRFLSWLWPLIKPYVDDIVRDLLLRLKKLFYEWMDDRERKRQAEAGRNAEEAERAARESQTPAQRSHHDEVARIWREVAEQFRSENEQMKAKLEQLIASEQTRASLQLAEEQPRLEMVKGRPQLRIGASSVDLPEQFQNERQTDNP